MRCSGGNSEPGILYSSPGAFLGKGSAFLGERSDASYPGFIEKFGVQLYYPAKWKKKLRK